MFTQAVNKQLGTLASMGLFDAYTDFVLSRQTMYKGSVNLPKRGVFLFRYGFKLALEIKNTEEFQHNPLGSKRYG